MGQGVRVGVPPSSVKRQPMERASDKFQCSILGKMATAGDREVRIDPHTGQRFVTGDDIIEEKRPVVSEKHFEYIRDRTVQEDEALANLKKKAIEKGMPPIWISPEQGAFMKTLLGLAGAKTVIEVGTLAGYSAIWMARALPEGGKVHSLEIDADFAAFAAERIDEAGESSKVQIHVGDAKDTLRKMKEGGIEGVVPGEVDACFLDGDKVSYQHYANEAKALLRPGGMLLVDNAFAFGHLFSKDHKDEDVRAIQAFNDYLHGDSDYEGVLMPIGDGLWVTRKL